MTAIGLLDVEGFTLARGGSNRNKNTTMVPFAVAALRVLPDGSVESWKTWVVRPRGFDPAQFPADRTTVAVALAKCKNRGLFARAEAHGEDDTARVVREVRAFFGAHDEELPVYARGTSMEVRFLSGCGLSGEVALSRDAAAACPLRVRDLAVPRSEDGQPLCPAFPGAVHNPLDELRFFAPYALRIHREGHEC